MSGTNGVGSVADRLEALCVLAAGLPGSVSVQLAGDEELLRLVAGHAGAQVFGLVTVGDGEPPRVSWSCACQRDRVRVTATFSRMATPAELQAVSKWQASAGAQTGLLHRFIDRELTP